MTNRERARKWLTETWPWSLDKDGPSEREVGLLTALLDDVTAPAPDARCVTTGDGRGSASMRFRKIPCVPEEVLLARVFRRALMRPQSQHCSVLPGADRSSTGTFARTA